MNERYILVDEHVDATMEQLRHAKRIVKVEDGPDYVDLDADELVEMLQLFALELLEDEYGAT